MMARVEGAVEVRVDERPPRGGQDLGDELALVLADIVDEQIEAPRRLVDLGEHPGNILGIGEVSFESAQRSFGPLATDVVEDLERFAPAPTVVDEDGIATGSERVREIRTEPPGRAGHHGNRQGQGLHVTARPLPWRRG
jgi:hypothetical protein